MSDNNGFPFGNYVPGNDSMGSNNSSKARPLDPVETIPDGVDLGNLDVTERAAALAYFNDHGGHLPTHMKQKKSS